MKQDIFRNNLEVLANQLLEADTQEQIDSINNKIDMISKIISDLDGKPQAKKASVLKPASTRKAYQIDDVLGLGYGQAVSFTHRTYKPYVKGIKPTITGESTAYAEYLGIIALSMNNLDSYAIGFKVLKPCLDLEAGKIYAFKLESIKGLKLIES